ncbi:MAG: PAS domain S-box protein [Bacteroidota bacterium]
MEYSFSFNNEKHRVNALHQYNILDTHEEQDYDDIVELATQICDVPIGMINLIDEDRQWSKAKKGIKENEIARSLSFCTHAIRNEEVMIVKDAQKDERFLDNPYVVNKPFIRFYAAVPLSTKEGYHIGTLAVIDQKPKELSSSQLLSLRRLAKQVMTLLNLRLNVKKRETAEKKLQTINRELTAKVKEKTSEITNIFERVSDSFIAINEDGNITYVNKKAEKLINNSSGKILGKSILDIFPKTMGLELYQLAKKATINQKKESYQLYYNNSKLWFDIQIYPSPSGISIFFHDITEWKVAEQKRNAEKYFSDSIINGLPGIFYLFDTNQKFLRWNKNFETVSGYSGQEIKQMSPLDFFDVKNQQRIQEAIETVFEKGTVDIEAPFMTKTGDKIPHYFTGKFDNFEGTPCLLGLGMDITDRKQAEEKYRNIFKNSLEGIYQSSIDGKFITANPALAKILGYETPEELIASINNIEEQLYKNPKDRLKLRHLLRKKNQVNGYEMKVMKKNKDIIWVNVNIRSIIGEQGNTLYLEGILQDITKRKVAEEKLRKQFKELQKTNFELDKFVYSVSHDLRAPLASILGLINVAQIENPTDPQNKYWDMVRKSINKLEGFIRDILDYSNNSRTEINIKKIDFKKIMDEVQENFSYLKGIERLNIEIEINDKVPFYSDENRIKIILNNLFSNAIKYQDLNKKSSYFKLNIEISEKQALINISDNGIGIEEAHLDKVFNMFYRASENSKGSGLGLYITNEIVLKLGGTINIKSEEGKGTSFEIIIPSLNLNRIEKLIK